METKPPKLVYVTGLAYSGTTLFSASLGHSEGFFNAGEINYLENDYHNNKVCSCGQKVDDCQVWRPVLRLLKSESDKHVKTLSFSQKQCLRAVDKRSKPLRVRILTLFGKRPEDLFGSDELEDYALRHRNFVNAVSSTVGANYVIDASKNFTRLHALRHYTDLAIHVVYVRRSIIQSYASRLKRAKRRNSFYVPLFAPLYLGVILFRVRDLRRRLQAFDPKDVSIIDYETFTEDPQSVAAQLSDELGVPVDLGIKNSQFSLDHLHVFTGNIWLSQASKSGQKVTIKSSDGRATLSWFERLSFRALMPVFKLLGE